VVTTLLDHQRQARRGELLRKRLQIVALKRAEGEGSQDTVLDRLDQDDRLRKIAAWMEEHVTDPLERQVLSLSFEHDLSPAEIVRRAPDTFPDVQTVNRIKERLLKRARRAFAEI